MCRINSDGRRFRILTVLDDCTRQCMALVADTSLSGIRVVRELDRLVIERAASRRWWSATTHLRKRMLDIVEDHRI